MISIKRTNALWTGMALVAATAITPSNAAARPVVEQHALPLRSSVTPLPRSILLADNVVVSPGTAQAPAQPSPAVAIPQAAQPAAQQAPVIEQPSKHKEVHAEVTSSPNYMSTIAISALMGGLAGGLVGGALHYIDKGEAWRNVGYWAAGGVLVGTGVGITQLIIQESRVSEAAAWNHFPTDPAPTYRLALVNLRF